MFKLFVKNGKFTKYDHHCRYRPYNTFLSNQIAKDIQFEDDKSLTTHRLRHACGMHYMNDEGMKESLVAKMMGNDINTVLQNYADLSPDNVLLEQKKILEKKAV